MKIKKLVALAAAAVLSFSLVGCSVEGEGSSTGSSAEARKWKYRILCIYIKQSFLCNIK